MDEKQWMIYGATGYTGGLMAARALVEGSHPVLAGRDEAALRELGGKLGLPFRAFDLHDAASIAPVRFRLLAPPWRRAVSPPKHTILISPARSPYSNT